MQRPARSNGDDRPTSADAAETAQGSRSRPRAPRFQAPGCLLHTGQARLPPQLRALEPARALPAKSQSLLHAFPLPEQPGSQRAGCQLQARPVARQHYGQARRRTARQRRRRSATPHIGPPRRRTSSTWQPQSTGEVARCCASVHSLDKPRTSELRKDRGKNTRRTAASDDERGAPPSASLSRRDPHDHRRRSAERDRQAGGHWFEPSTAHFSPALLSQS